MKIKSILLLIVCVACSNPQSEFEQLLMNPDKKWVVYIEGEALNHPYGATTYTKFQDKTCENIDLKTNTKAVISIEGNNPPGKWKYDTSNKTLNMYGQYFFTITKFSPDTIYMINQKTKQKAYFINYASRK